MDYVDIHADYNDKNDNKDTIDDLVKEKNKISERCCCNKIPLPNW